jgi:hypothetical protein
MEAAGIFYGHSVNFPAIWYRYFMELWYIFWSLDIFFPGLGILYHEKSGNHGLITFSCVEVTVHDTFR